MLIFLDENISCSKKLKIEQNNSKNIRRVLIILIICNFISLILATIAIFALFQRRYTANFKLESENINQ